MEQSFGRIYRTTQALNTAFSLSSLACYPSMVVWNWNDYKPSRMSKLKGDLVSKGFKAKPGAVEWSCLLGISHPPLQVVKLQEPASENHIMGKFSFQSDMFWDLNIFGRQKKSLTQKIIFDGYRIFGECRYTFPFQAWAPCPCSLFQLDDRHLWQEPFSSLQPL